uniref:Uncharacterized protein n=1 Tax=Sipha flava TaxID=143950 RepID=A0A2S2Q2T4_9HEMI
MPSPCALPVCLTFSLKSKIIFPQTGTRPICCKRNFHLTTRPNLLHYVFECIFYLYLFRTWYINDRETFYYYARLFLQMLTKPIIKRQLFECCLFFFSRPIIII